MEEYLKNLVSFESTAENVKARKDIIRYIESKYKKLAFTKVLSKNNTNSLIVAFDKESILKPVVTFHGHLDVVAGDKEQFVMKQTRNSYVGRGVQDMKGACAIFMKLIDDYCIAEIKPKINFLFTTDEEVGGFDGAKFVVEKGLRPQFVITGESTDLEIGNRAKGIIWAKITCLGKAAHAAYLHNGDNAVLRLIQKIEVLRKRFPVPSKPSFKPTVNVSFIQTANTTVNKVPNEANCVIDIRYFDGQEKILKALNSLKDSKTAVEILEDEQVVQCPQDNAYAKSLAQIVKRSTKKAKVFVDKFGSSDLRHFAKIGAVGVEFGPVGEGLHSLNEKVSRKSLDQYYTILSDFIKQL